MWTKGAASPSTPKNFVWICPFPAGSGIVCWCGTWGTCSISCRSTGAMGLRAARAVGAGRSPQTARYGKADMAVMVMSAFFAGSIPSAEALPRYGVSSAPATTKRCRGTGKDSFPGRLKGHAAAFSRSPSCMGLLGKRRTGSAIGPQGAAGYRPSGRMPRRGGGSVATQEAPAPAAGTMAPCLTLFL